jgi:hypothetical protein
VKIKLVVTIVLLVFVAASVVALIMKGSGESDVEGSAEMAAGKDAEAVASGDSKIIAYYFHGNARCKTCLTIEMYTLEAIETGFPDALKANRIDFLPINLDLTENEHFIDDFQLAARTVVLQRVVNGETKDYVNLTRVWELVRDKEAFITYVQEETGKFINGES